MGTGYYQRVFHPVDMDQRSVEDLMEVIVEDVTTGVAGTGIRSGIIGEIGVNGNPITANDGEEHPRGRQGIRDYGRAHLAAQGAASAPSATGRWTCSKRRASTCGGSS